MKDKELLAIMIKDIDKFFSDLYSIHLENKKDLEEPEKRHAFSMLIFSIMNRAIDISNEIISGSKLPVPSSYCDSFEVLRQAKILTPKTTEQMAWLVKYRNIIAHQYYTLSIDEIYKLKKRICTDVPQFIEEIKRYAKI